ncbi:MAG: glutamine-synthetase adenylyltransferase, partial [Oceanibaculum nanhaiense]
KRDPATLLADVASMRARIAKEKPGDILWDVKMGRGGLVDVEFVAQYLQLRHAADDPGVLDQNTTAAFEKLIEARHLTPENGAALIAATRLWRRLQGLLRIAVGDATFDEEAATRDQKDALLRAGDAVDFDALKQNILATAGAAQACYRALIDDPAAALPDKSPQEKTR